MSDDDEEDDEADVVHNLPCGRARLTPVEIRSSSTYANFANLVDRSNDGSVIKEICLQNCKLDPWVPAFRCH